jgi:hypothetical protein
MFLSAIAIKKNQASKNIIMVRLRFKGLIGD